MGTLNLLLIFLDIVASILAITVSVVALREVFRPRKTKDQDEETS